MTAGPQCVARACRLGAILLATAVVVLAEEAAPATAQEDAWALLRKPGHVAFLRHAATPGGFGDPPTYRLDDCASQRNLVDSGRAQAARTGEAFRNKGLTFDRVLTSPWCRCKETARLVTGRDAQPMEALSNLVGRQEHAARQVAALKAYMAGLDTGTRALFITHGIVIGALVGINPAEGEMVIVKVGPRGEPMVAGRLKVD